MFSVIFATSSFYGWFVFVLVMIHDRGRRSVYVKIAIKCCLQ